MPIYLVRWPDLSASLVRAGSEGELPDILDQVANPEACEWTLYEGPLFIDFRLPVNWSIQDERPDEPVRPHQVVVGDIGRMASASIVEALDLRLAGEDGVDTALEIVRTAFPSLHAAVEKLHGSGEELDSEGVLPEPELRKALHAELARHLQWSWRHAQLQKKTDPISRLAREMDMPAAMVRRYAEQAQTHEQADEGGEREPCREGEKTDWPLFNVSNHHVEGCGQAPAVDGDAQGVYCGYFTNEHGEQAIYVYDLTTGNATVRLGDAGWDNAHPVVDGRAEGLVLSKAEAAWLHACWLATGALR